MSRSFKKNPFTGWSKARSEKQDKRLANRLERRINKVLLNDSFDESSLRNKREVTNVWVMNKDGKMRFDPTQFPKYLRK